MVVTSRAGVWCGEVCTDIERAWTGWRGGWNRAACDYMYMHMQRRCGDDQDWASRVELPNPVSHRRETDLSSTPTTCMGARSLIHAPLRYMAGSLHVVTKAANETL